GYPLEGLAPSQDGWVMCPECSLPQHPSLAGRRGRSGGPYGVSLLASLAVHAASWALMLTYAESRTAPLFVPFFIIATPLASTVIGSVLGCWRARSSWSDSKNRGWRIAGLIVVTAVFNVLVFVPLLGLGLARAVPTY